MDFQPLSDQVTLLITIESFFLVPKSFKAKTLFELLDPRQAKSKEILGGYNYKRKLFQCYLYLQQDNTSAHSSTSHYVNQLVKAGDSLKGVIL